MRVQDSRLRLILDLTQQISALEGAAVAPENAIIRGIFLEISECGLFDVQDLGNGLEDQPAILDAVFERLTSLENFPPLGPTGWYRL